MTTPTLIVLLVAVVAVFVLPRRWVPVPFLVLACYVSRTQVIDVGPFSFTVLRSLTIVALARAVVRSDWTFAPTLNDYLMLAWSVLMVATVALHVDPSSQVVERFGLVVDAFGLYLVFRLFCRSRQDIECVCVALAVVIVPLAAAMLYEKLSAHNILSVFGAREVAAIRDGRVRAQGPFRHAILAGTVGALSAPLIATVWPVRRGIAAVGLLSCLSIVVTSTSSGPLLSLVAAILAMALWSLRAHVRMVAWCGVAVYAALTLVMNRPAYYAISMIDLTGSSTGWHRARLIESALTHLDEWWLVGTDYTRHWMATGVSWSPNHTDLTNYYIHLGVYGGLPLLACFLAVVVVSFRSVGMALRADEGGDSSEAFLPWALGSSLFTVAVTGVSISFFDQSLLWLCMTIACCAALTSARAVRAERAEASMRSVATHRVKRRVLRRTTGRSGPIGTPV